MRPRKITASPVKVTGFAPNDQPFESALEEDFFVLLRFNPQVRHWSRPKEAIPWRDSAGKTRHYTPDVLVEILSVDDGTRVDTVLCEIKPDFDEDDDRPVARLPRKETAEENEQKWKAATLYAARRGWTFRVYRESEIRNDYLRNAKFLLRYLERAPREHGKQELLATLSEHGPLSIHRLVSMAAHSEDEQVRLFPTLYRLIATREVQVDLTSLLTTSTLCSLADGN